MQQADTLGADPTLLFHAGRQAVKVRFIMALSLATAAGALYWSVDLVQHYGLAPADGGVLAPLWQRAAWALVVAGFAGAFVFGMWVYGRQYVLDARLLPETHRLRLRTLTFLGADVHDVDPADVRIGRSHAGQLWVPDPMNPGLTKFTVDAPWGAVQVKGRRWPLIIDFQGVFKEPAGRAGPDGPRLKKRRR